MSVEVLNPEGHTVEKVTFDPNSMMYVPKRERRSVPRDPAVGAPALIPLRRRTSARGSTPSSS